MIVSNKKCSHCLSRVCVLLAGTVTALINPKSAEYCLVFFYIYSHRRLIYMYEHAAGQQGMVFRFAAFAEYMS